jgi:hypothetical protein
MPKNVPTAQAQRERGSDFSDALLAAALIFSVNVMRPWFDFLEQLGIQYWRADAICAARPFPQVDQPASIAAKREVLGIAQYNCLASGTT